MTSTSFWGSGAVIGAFLMGCLPGSPDLAPGTKNIRTYALNDCTPLVASEVSEFMLDASNSLEARRCPIATNTTVYVFQDFSENARAWPVVELAGARPESLEEALASSPWFEDTRLIRVRWDADCLFVIVGTDSTHDGAVMTGYAMGTLDDEPVEAFIGIRISPKPCLLHVSSSFAAALEAVGSPSAGCLPAHAG